MRSLPLVTHAAPRDSGGGALPAPKFLLGRIFMTPGAIEALSPDDVHAALARHAQGDWGDCSAEDAAENDFSVPRYLRIFSVYHSVDGVKFWVITEADRSVTTILLPNEY